MCSLSDPTPLVSALGLALAATLAPMGALAADLAATQVEAVEVVGALPNPQKQDLALSTTVSTSLQDTPQVVTTVLQALLQEQRVTTLEQALRDVPGITVAIGEGGTLAGDQFKIRGLDANNDIYTDGLRDFGVYTRDAFDYQEVQVLKGPSGAMFGRGSTGGAINTISKQPLTKRNFLNVDATVGTGNYYRATLDLNHRIDDTTAVRLILMANATGVTGRDAVGSDRWGVAATIGFGLGTATSLTVNYLHQEDDRTPDYGIVIGAPTGVIAALPATEYGLSPRVFEQFTTDHDRTRADVLTARFKREVNPNLTLTNDVRVGRYDRDFQYTSVDSCLVNAVTGLTCIDALIDGDPATRPLITFGGGGPYAQRAWGAQDIAALHGRLEIAGFRNEVVAGVDLNHQDNRKAFSAYTLPPLSSGIYAPGVIVPARNQIAIDLLTGGGAPPAGYAAFRPTLTPGVGASGIAGTSITSSAYVVDSVGSSTDYAGFVTDRLWLTPTLSVIAGVRYDLYQADYRNVLISGVEQSFDTTAHLTSPRVSVVYEPTRERTLYASYGKSVTPVGSGIVGTATPIASTTAAFAPDEAESFEIGAKASILRGRLGLDAAWFHVDKANAKMTDPVSGEIAAQSSQKQTFQGVELGATGKLTPQWSVNAAYTLVDSTVRQDLVCTTATGTVAARCYPNPFTTGRAVLQVPRNSAFLWTSYRLGKILPGLSVAGGFTYQDGFHVRYTTVGTPPDLTLTRDAQIPSTFSLDGLIQYETRRWRLALNLYNLTDRLNYAQSFGNRAAPAQGRTVLVSVGTSF